MLNIPEEDDLFAKIAEVVKANGYIHITDQHLSECGIHYNADLIDFFKRLATENGWNFSHGIEDGGWMRAGGIASKTGEHGYVFTSTPFSDKTTFNEVGFSYAD